MPATVFLFHAVLAAAGADECGAAEESVCLLQLRGPIVEPEFGWHPEYLEYHHGQPPPPGSGWGFGSPSPSRHSAMEYLQLRKGARDIARFTGALRFRDANSSARFRSLTDEVDQLNHVDASDHAPDEETAGEVWGLVEDPDTSPDWEAEEVLMGSDGQPCNDIPSLTSERCGDGAPSVTPQPTPQIPAPVPSPTPRPPPPRRRSAPGLDSVLGSGSGLIVRARNVGPASIGTYPTSGIHKHFFPGSHHTNFGHAGNYYPVQRRGQEGVVFGNERTVYVSWFAANGAETVKLFDASCCEYKTGAGGNLLWAVSDSEGVAGPPALIVAIWGGKHDGIAGGAGAFVLKIDAYTYEELKQVRLSTHAGGSPLASWTGSHSPVFDPGCDASCDGGFRHPLILVGNQGGMTNNHQQAAAHCYDPKDLTWNPCENNRLAGHCFDHSFTRLPSGNLAGMATGDVKVRGARFLRGFDRPGWKTRAEVPFTPPPTPPGGTMKDAVLSTWNTFRCHYGISLLAWDDAAAAEATRLAGNLHEIAKPCEYVMTTAGNFLGIPPGWGKCEPKNGGYAGGTVSFNGKNWGVAIWSRREQDQEKKVAAIHRLCIGCLDEYSIVNQIYKDWGGGAWADVFLEGKDFEPAFEMTMYRQSRRVGCGVVNDIPNAPAAYAVCLYDPPRPANAGWAVTMLDINREKYLQCQKVHDPWAPWYRPNLDHNAPVRSRCSPLQNLPHPPTTKDWPNTCDVTRRRFSMYNDAEAVGGKPGALDYTKPRCYGSCGYTPHPDAPPIVNSPYFSSDKLSRQYNEVYLEIAHPGILERQDFWGLFVLAGENTGNCGCGCEWHDPPSATCKLRNVALVRENNPGRENAMWVTDFKHPTEGSVAHIKTHHLARNDHLLVYDVWKHDGGWQRDHIAFHRVNDDGQTKGILTVQTPYRLMARDIPTVVDGKMVLYTSTEAAELVRIEVECQDCTDMY